MSYKVGNFFARILFAIFVPFFPRPAKTPQKRLEGSQNQSQKHVFPVEKVCGREWSSRGSQVHLPTHVHHLAVVHLVVDHLDVVVVFLDPTASPNVAVVCLLDPDDPELVDAHREAVETRTCRLVLVVEVGDVVLGQVVY